MARFQRPANTIEDAADLKVGDHIWHVYGIWTPQMGGEFVVTRGAGKFRDHPEYSDIHESLADEIVFDEKYTDKELVHMVYASDCGMQPGHSHNNNYCFRSEEAAIAAVDFLKEQWEASGMISAEIERRLNDLQFYEDMGL